MGNLEIIDIDSKIAYYVQLKEALQRKIENFEYKPGDKLPSEAELCQQTNVSRTVVRQALMELEHEGLVYKRKGKGTFVAKPKTGTTLAQFHTSFNQDMDNQDQEAITKVLFQHVIPAPHMVAQKLCVAEGDPVLKVDHLRIIEDSPIGLRSTYLVYQYCRGLESADFSKSVDELLYDLCNIDLEFSERTFEAVGANEKEAGLFGVTLGTPMISMNTTNYTGDWVPIEFDHLVLRGDQSRVEAKIMHCNRFTENSTVIVDNKNHFFFNSG